MTFLFWVGLVCLVASLAIALEVAGGIGRMTQIRDITARPGNTGPLVSIIVPACNEAETIEPALRSLLAQDYANLEIIVVNDRSVDATGEVLARMALDYPALKLKLIEELPEGWLGKNNALQSGAEMASGEYLLFTDADVSMEKTTISRAMQHVLANSLDHLSIFFENVGGSGLLNALFLEVGGGLLLLFRPWKAKDPKSKCFMGVGAFNLVKASTYREIGGHHRIAMHPIDDVMLGKLIKRQGFRQDCLLGNGMVSVPWYGTVREFINGLMKNTFAAYQYRLSAVTAGVFGVVLIGVLPAWGLLFGDAPARLVFGGTVAIRILSFLHGFRQGGVSPWYAGWSLVTPYLSIYIIVKATILTIHNQGITWRGTHYPLAKLKQYVV